MSVTLAADGGELIAAGPVTFRILQDGRGIGGRVGVAELRIAPGWAGPPQHVHREHDETFYVVSGTVRFTSGSEVFLATTGSLVTAAMGDPHTFANADPDAPASMLCTVTPERYLGYFRELQGLSVAAGGHLDPAEMLAVMERYATEPYRGLLGVAS